MDKAKTNPLFDSGRIDFYDRQEPSQGDLLIASPTLKESHFKKTVLLLCEHDQTGSFALVLNRTLQMSLGDAMDHISGWDSPLHQGGPIQSNVLQFIHNQHETVEGSEAISEDLAWGGRFEDLEEIITRQEDPKLRYKFFIGYSGWAAGQLDFEIRQKSWLVTPIDKDLIFSHEGVETWKKAICKLGKKHEILLNYPPDLQLN